MITLDWSHIFAIIGIAVSGYLTLLLMITKITGRVNMLSQCVEIIKKNVDRIQNANEMDHNNFYHHKDILRDEMNIGMQKIESRMNMIDKTLAAILERLEMRRKNET
jgi:hypothetical protein